MPFLRAFYSLRDTFDCTELKSKLSPRLQPLPRDLQSLSCKKRQTDPAQPRGRRQAGKNRSSTSLISHLRYTASMPRLSGGLTEEVHVLICRYEAVYCKESLFFKFVVGVIELFNSCISDSI